MDTPDNDHFFRTSNHLAFAAVAAKSSREILELQSREEEIRSISSPLPPPDEHYLDRHEEIRAIEQSLFVAACHSVIYSAMTAEAYIFDYAARNLGDSYVIKHIDKLDVVSKWVIVPSLVLGRGASVSAESVEGLKGIVKTRNQLIHHRSIDLLGTPPEHFEMLEKKMGSMIDLAAKAPNRVLALAQSLIGLDPKESPANLLQQIILDETTTLGG